MAMTQAEADKLMTAYFQNVFKAQFDMMPPCLKDVLMTAPKDDLAAVIRWGVAIRNKALDEASAICEDYKARFTAKAEENEAKGKTGELNAHLHAHFDKSAIVALEAVLETLVRLSVPDADVTVRRVSRGPNLN